MTVKPGYAPQAADVSVETDVFEFGLLRQRTNCDRILMGASLTQNARLLSLCGLRRTRRSLSPQEFALVLAQAFLGEHIPPNFIPSGTEMTWIQDSISLALQLQEILIALQIPHYITGGIAATTYGEPRTTRDLDMVVFIQMTQLDPLVQRLESNGFYVPGIEDVRSGRLKTLSITHQETIARADLMVSGSSPFEQEQLTRRLAIEIPGKGTLYLISPEDLILNKLLWGRVSQSEKQWRDVLGILKVQGPDLDLGYLTLQAERLELSERLAQAMAAAGL